VTFVSHILLVTTLAAIPALDATQQRIIDTAEDGSQRLDEAAWYPLLRNATDWSAGDEAGARIPDYDALLQAPDAHRGELYLIEGQFAGRPRELGLARPGPWGETVTEWGIVTDAQQDRVAMVYLVDQPMGEGSNQPFAGQRVRVAARFYKVWAQRDLEGQPTLFLTFVGHSLTIDPIVGAPGPDLREYWGVGLGVLIFIAAAYFFGKRMMTMGQPRPLPSRVVREPYHEDEDEPQPETETEPDPDLPHDPDQALAELERRARMRGPSQDA